jgi:acyl-CoA synthetase (AMP-forming)/AMP-acid ligase II
MNDLGAQASGNDLQLEPSRSDPPGSGSQHAAACDRDLFSNEPCAIGALIRAHAGLRPGAPAIVGTAFAPLSYRELQEQIEEVRRCLRQAGFDRNARIAVGIADSAQAAWTIVTVACSAAAVPLDPKLTAAEIERCMLILRPSAVIVLRDAASAARQVAEQQKIPIIEAMREHPGKLALQLAMSSVGSACAFDDPEPDAPAFILHTSGTSAEPNLVPFSHRNLLTSTKRVHAWFGLTPQDRCLSVSPVYYSHALTTTVMPPLLTGGSAAYPANPLNVDLSEWFGTLSPTWYSAGPTLHLAVLEKIQLRPDGPPQHSLRLISSAGAQLPRHVQEGLQGVLGVPVLEHYGSSETAQISANMPPPGPRKPGTCGIPWPDTLKIVGEDGRQLSAGEQGEILVSGPNVMSGYLNAPGLNELVFVDGWYRTGDVGSLDEQGFLSLHARKRELINRGAEKISPLEIDQALMRHPQVAEAAAYGVPHPRFGEDVAAAVVLRPDAKIGAAELRTFLGERLAAFKIPRRISIVERLPKGITGKVQRNRLSEVVAEPSIPRNGRLPGELLQLWQKLKQFAAFHAPRSVLGLSPKRGTGEVKPASPDTVPPVLSESRLQAELLEIWKKVLRLESLSIDDDFFYKGGNSLLAMDLHVEIQRLTGKTLPESFLSEASTIRALAKALAS